MGPGNPSMPPRPASLQRGGAHPLLQ
jgi:hypothetical protein